MYLAGQGLSQVNWVNIMAVWVPIASEVTLKDMGKIGQYQTTTKHNNMQTMCICLGMYPMSKMRKNIYRSDLWALCSFQMFTGPIFQVKLHFAEYCITQWISKLPGSFEIHWVKQYLVKFHGSGGHSKCKCLHDRANSHRSLAWLIVLIFNTSTIYIGEKFQLDPDEKTLAEIPSTKEYSFSQCSGKRYQWFSARLQYL